MPQLVPIKPRLWHLLPSQGAPREGSNTLRKVLSHLAPEQSLVHSPPQRTGVSHQERESLNKTGLVSAKRLEINLNHSPDPCAESHIQTITVHLPQG